MMQDENKPGQAVPPAVNGAAVRASLGVLSDGELAAALGISPYTLMVWRSERKGPSYSKLGKNVLYPVSAVLRWIELNSVDTHRTAALDHVDEVPRRPQVARPYITPLRR